MYRIDQISRFNPWVFRLWHFGRQEVTWSNWVTKGLRLIAFAASYLQAVYHTFLGQWVSFRSARRDVCQKEELCNTSVGCSWLLCKVCNPEKWCLLVKGSYCASSLRAQLFSRCLSEQRTRTRDLQALCAEATLPLCFWSSRAVSQRSFCWCSKRSHIVQFQLHRSREQISRHTGVVWNASWNSVSFWISLWQLHCPQNSIITPPYPTSFNFTIWCRIWGVECNVRWCRTSAGQVMKVIDFWWFLWKTQHSWSQKLSFCGWIHRQLQFSNQHVCRNLVCLRGSLDAWDSRLKGRGP